MRRLKSPASTSATVLLCQMVSGLSARMTIACSALTACGGECLKRSQYLVLTFGSPVWAQAQTAMVEMIPVCAEHFQVIRVVVLAVPIPVMHDLFRVQIAAKLFFHHKAMLCNITLFCRIRVLWAIDVPVAANKLSPALPVWVAIPASWTCTLSADAMRLTRTANRINGHAKSFCRKVLLKFLVLNHLPQFLNGEMNFCRH